MKYYSSSDNIQNLIDSAMDKIKTIVDSSTVIGEKVETSDGTTIIPISRVSVGYVVGGGEYADLSSRRVANHFPMAGGSSGGMSLSPVGFLIVTEGDVKFVNVENKSLYQTILNLFNNLISKIDENAANQTRAQEGYYEQAEYKEGQSDEI
ncbi:MAG: sporulation protein YtfJ [Clostridia bacterium]|jgi:sporulation protein YtfJ|nr:sporulation protein YtfJ [Clostridia bacterium]